MKKRFRVKLRIDYDYPSQKEDMKEFISHCRCIRGSRFWMERLSRQYCLINSRYTLSRACFNLKTKDFLYLL